MSDNMIDVLGRLTITAEWEASQVEGNPGADRWSQSMSIVEGKEGRLTASQVLTELLRWISLRSDEVLDFAADDAALDRVKLVLECADDNDGLSELAMAVWRVWIAYSHLPASMRRSCERNAIDDLKMAATKFEAAVAEREQSEREVQGEGSQ